MSAYRYIALRDAPQRMDEAAGWFHDRWGVPVEEYRAAMADYLERRSEYGWYLCLCDGAVVGGLGVIENDFHDRRDLSPNLCAVYTDAAHRGRGIAGRLLALAVDDLRAKGVSPVYLVTDHVGFYERYGWEYLCTALDEGTHRPTRVYVHR